MSSQPASQSDSRFLTLTGTVVVTLGLPVLISLLQNAKQDVVVSPAVATGRTPASEQSVVPSTKLGVEVIELGCGDKEVTQSVDSSRIRIRGKDCKNQSDLSIENSTSGYLASIVEHRPGEFTTDYIDLAVGENQIHVQAKDERGNLLSKVLKLSRRAPASQ